MPPSRRTFLATAGTVLAASAVRRGHNGAFGTLFEEATMEITRVGSQPSAKGPAEWFTGTVRIDPPVPAKPPAGAYAFRRGADEHKGRDVTRSVRGGRAEARAYHPP